MHLIQKVFLISGAASSAGGNTKKSCSVLYCTHFHPSHMVALKVPFKPFSIKKKKYRSEKLFFL